MTVPLLLAAAQRTSMAEFSISFLPIIVFLLILFILLRVVQKRTKTQISRSLAHMDAMEQKADRIIELLEEIKKK